MVAIISLFYILSIALVNVNCHKYRNPLDFIKFENAVTERDSSIKLTVSPDMLETSGTWATVTWSGVSNPTSDDWIGLYIYSPSADGMTIDPQKHAPVKYQYCHYASTHLSDGKGSFRFYIVNMRASLVFGLLRNGLDNPTLAATSNTVKFANYNEPLQGHIMLTGDPTKIKLVWVTKDSDNPEVKYGLLYGTARQSAKADSTTYKASDLCGHPASDVGFIDPGQIHTATMENLSPGQKYTYNFGDDKYGWSKMFNFTVPAAADPTATTKIVTFGDMGHGLLDDTRQKYPSEMPSLNTTRLILEQEMNDTSVILHIGDISYAVGYGAEWDEFFDQIQPMATHVPYMVSMGNHERDFPSSGSYYAGTDSGGECGVPYEMKFPMPRVGKDKDWYTFIVGSVQVVLMSTEHNFTTGSTQYNWIKDTLSKVDKSKTPWLIFSGHRPMYCDSTNEEEPAGDQPVARELRKYIEPLLMQYKVDLSLWGHHHSYQRTCPVYQEKCTEGASVHVVIGMAGQGLSRNINEKAPSWIEKIDVDHYGYSRITTNQTTLVFEYVQDDDGKVHDTLILKNKLHE